MNSAQLERLRQKVEAGEVLSREEFESLEQLARQQKQPWLLITIAQALINADQPEPALSRLEVVRREFPRDPQGHLAFARALIALERWADAEGPLRTVLALQPKDPEALKTLALLAMRRGELQRARALVAEALAEDPLDGEAQQLLMELDAHPAPQSTEVPLLPDFTRALTERLKAQSTPHLLQKQHLLVRLGTGGVARVDLKSLFAGHLDSGRSLESSVKAIAEELAERSLGLPEGTEGLLSQVLPVLRAPSFLEHAVGAVHREGPAGLLVFYVLEDPELVRYVPEGALKTHQVTLEALDEQAWKNLDSRPAALRALEMEQGALRVSDAPTGLWAFAQGDGHDSARLLTPAHQAALRARFGEAPLRAYFGLRELVLLCREDDPPWLARLGELDASREGIRGLFRWAQGRLTAVSEWSGV